MKNIKEVWKDIKRYEGYYQISNKGNVRSVEREVIYSNGRHYIYPSKIIKTFQDKKGYILVTLSKSNKLKTMKVHRLVAEAFIENLYNLPQVNHKDEDKTNNKVENLEWCDSKYNNNYGTKIKRFIKKNRNNKLSKPVYQYDLHGNLIKEWPSSHECGRNGFDASSVSLCCNGKLKTHKGYIWSFSCIDKTEMDKYKNNSIKSVYQYDLNKNIINIFDKVSDVKKIGFDPSSVIKCCKGKIKQHKGYLWEYKL